MRQMEVVKDKERRLRSWRKMEYVDKSWHCYFCLDRFHSEYALIEHTKADHPTPCHR